MYIGDADDDGAGPHVFQDTVSYVRFGSRLDLTRKTMTKCLSILSLRAR